jgi:DNA replication and repair protein RecF
VSRSSDALFIQSLQVRDFRNCDFACLEFSPQVNLIFGQNAQGKTSLLEAIYLCVAGRSFRTSQIADLVRYQQSHFYVEIRFVKNTVEQRIRIAYGDGERQIFYNSTACQSAAALLGIIPGVAMTTEDIGLVRGTPQLRRHFLDLQIAQTDPLYLHHLTRFQRAMRQRNQLLKSRTTLSIEGWEMEMAVSAAYVVKARIQAVDDIQRHAQTRYFQLAHEEELFEVTYKSGAPLQDSAAELQRYYLKQYQHLRQREMQLGATLHGPHRDDLELWIDGREARSYASEGQQRSCVTALRLAEYDRLHALSGMKPLLIIDDVAVSLDCRRSAKLMAQLLSVGQVFVSTVDDLTSHFPKETVRAFSIFNGSLALIP